MFLVYKELFNPVKRGPATQYKNWQRIGIMSHRKENSNNSHICEKLLNIMHKKRANKNLHKKKANENFDLSDTTNLIRSVSRSDKVDL